jgi:hypothetical protein
MGHEEMIRLYEAGKIKREVLDAYEDKLLMENRERREKRDIFNI